MCWGWHRLREALEKWPRRRLSSHTWKQQVPGQGWARLGPGQVGTHRGGACWRPAKAAGKTPGRQAKYQHVAGRCCQGGWRRAWGRDPGVPEAQARGQNCSRRTGREPGAGNGLGPERGSGGHPGRLTGLPAACRTRWMPIPVAQTTRPAPWPVVSPWKPRLFWSGQGFS